MSRRPSPRTPTPLRRLDDATLAVLRRLTAPLAAAVRWERDRGPAPVRRVAAHPAVTAVLAGLLVVAGAGVHLARFPDRAGPQAAAPEPVLEVGPPAGADVDAYAATRHERLAQVGADEVLRAIVSFRTLVPVDRLPLGDDVRVERLHVLLPGETTPREIPAKAPKRTLSDLFERGRADLEREIEELERLLSEDLGDPAFEADFRDQLEELRALRDDARRDAPVVFAAVVVAPAATLAELTDHRQVRLVDAAGPPAATRGTRFVGVPPEADRASTERDGSPSAASCDRAGGGC